MSKNELRSSGEHRRCAFANGAGELVAIPPECAVRQSESVAYATCRTRPKGALLRLDHNQFFRIQCTLHHFIDAVL